MQQQKKKAKAPRRCPFCDNEPRTYFRKDPLSEIWEANIQCLHPDCGVNPGTATMYHEDYLMCYLSALIVWDGEK